MALDLSVKTDLADLERRLRAMARGLGDPVPMLETIGSYLVNEAQKTFDAQASPWGDPWPPSGRVRKIAAGRAAGGGGGLTLVDTGFMRSSFSQYTLGGSVFFQEGMNAMNYFRFHQWGTRRMPARPMVPLKGPAAAPRLDLPPGYERKIVEIAEKYINGIIS
jgi:phage gpG-like protein